MDNALAFRHLLLKRAYARGEFLHLANQSRFRTYQIEVASIGLRVRFTKLEPAAARGGLMRPGLAPQESLRLALAK
jgi:hypothetical protein